MPENMEEYDDTHTLIAYRLGRLEKQLEENNRGTVSRFENLTLKLEGLGDIEKYARENRIRIEMLEKSRERLVGVISVVATGLIMILADIFFGIVGG